MLQVNSSLAAQSAAPFLMPEKRGVQQIAARSAVRQILIYQTDEAITMFSLQVVRHLVHGNVLEAIQVLLGEFGIKPHMTGLLGQGCESVPITSS
jgi:hypothetical protein